jgi:hypothetical protein
MSGCHGNGSPSCRFITSTVSSHVSAGLFPALRYRFQVPLPQNPGTVSQHSLHWIALLITLGWNRQGMCLGKTLRMSPFLPVFLGGHRDPFRSKVDIDTPLFRSSLITGVKPYLVILRGQHWLTQGSTSQLLTAMAAKDIWRFCFQ